MHDVNDYTLKQNIVMIHVRWLHILLDSVYTAMK